MARQNLDFLPTETKQVPDYDVKLPFETTLEEDLRSRGIYIGDPTEKKESRTETKKKAEVKVETAAKTNVSFFAFLRLHPQFTCMLSGVLLVVLCLFGYFYISHINYNLGREVNNLSVKITRAESENARLEKKKSSICMSVGVDDFAVYNLGMVQGITTTNSEKPRQTGFSGTVTYCEEKKDTENSLFSRIKEKIASIVSRK